MLNIDMAGIFYLRGNWFQWFGFATNNFPLQFGISQDLEFYECYRQEIWFI